MAISIKGPRFSMMHKGSAAIEIPTFWDNFSIQATAGWKIYFDLWIAALAIYSTFSSAYFAGHGIPETSLTIGVVLVVEFFFTADLVLNCLT